MKKLIAIAFFAVSVVTSSAQTINKYQKISLDKFIALKDSLNTDSLLEFEVFTFSYIGINSLVLDTALSDLKKHNLPETDKATLFIGTSKFSSNDDIVHLLNTTYVCIISEDNLGTSTITLNIIASRLNVTLVDDSIK